MNSMSHSERLETLACIIELFEDFLNGVPYEDHVKTPSDPLPTWGEIFTAIRENVPSGVRQAEIIMKRFDMDSVCTPNWEYPADEWDD